jgi:hypothetical protein
MFERLLLSHFVKTSLITGILLPVDAVSMLLSKFDAIGLLLQSSVHNIEGVLS